jgi:hypothetical protein
VAATEHALAELPAVDLSELDLMALLVDSVKVAGHAAWSLGITIDGSKVPLLRVAPDATIAVKPTKEDAA